MRVLVAPDSFAGTLTAGEAADAVAAGWLAQVPDDEITTCPLSDGGPGFVDVLHRTLGGTLLSVTVTGPLGDAVPATVLRVGRTAYVESAQACGVHLLPASPREPARTTTAGVGRLLQAALASGASRVVVGVGGSGALDGGAGMLAALGAGPADVLAAGGGALEGLPDGALGGLPDVRSALGDVELVAATDVDVPLLGFKGAAALLAEDQGASAERAQQLDRALGRFAQVALDALDAPQRLVAEPGAGAGGGLGFALMLLGATRQIGVEAVLGSVGFDARLRECDLVLTGEGTVDWRSLRSSVVAGVAHAALDAGVPAVVLAGQVHSGRRELLSIGVESAYAVAETPDQVAAALADPGGTLAARARRVARTWSRRS